MEACLSLCVLGFLGFLIYLAVQLGKTSQDISVNKEHIKRLRQRLNGLEQQFHKLRHRLELSGEESSVVTETKPVESQSQLELQPNGADRKEEDFIELEIVPEEEEDFVSSDFMETEEKVPLISSQVPSEGLTVQSEESEEEENSWEQILAGRWLSWLGAITVIIGAGFFFKYTIDMGWIGPRERVLIGLGTGLLTFIGGVWAMRRDYSYLGQGLVGSAMGILYFSIFASVEWYHLVPVSVGLTGLIIVTTMMLAFAAWSDTQITAMLGMFGGFLTPLMLWPGVHSLNSLFSYLFILNLGILFVTTIRKWSGLQLLALAGTAISWSAWLGQYYNPLEVRVTFLWMTAFFAQFALLSVWNHLAQRRSVEALDLLLMLATPFLYLGGFLFITKGSSWEDWQGLYSLSLAVVYGLLAVVCRYRIPENRELAQIQAGLAGIFFVLAVPLHFEGHWIPLMWTAQSLLLVFTGFRMRDPRVRIAGLSLLSIVQLFLIYYTLVTIEGPYSSYWEFVKEPTAFIPHVDFNYEFSVRDLFNERSITFLASLFAMIVLGVKYRLWSLSTEETTESENSRWTMFSVNDREELLGFSGSLIVGALVTFFVMVCNEALMFGKLMDWISFAYAPLLSILVTFTALMTWVYFSRWKPHWGLALVYWIMLLGGLSLVVNGMHTLMGWKSEYSVALDPERYAQFWKWPLLNLRFTGHGILVLLAGWFCRCAPKLTQLFPEAKERKPHEFDLFYLEASTWRVSFGFFALFTSFVLVTLEAYSIGVQRQWGTGTSLSITAVWIGFGLILMLLGIAWKSVSLRTAALCVFLLTTSKVYLHDLWYLHTAIRTIAFIGLGVALLFIPWLYKRYRHRLKNVQQEINQIP